MVEQNAEGTFADVITDDLTERMVIIMSADSRESPVDARMDGARFSLTHFLLLSSPCSRLQQRRRELVDLADEPLQLLVGDDEKPSNFTTR